MTHPVRSVVESLHAAGRCPRLHVNALCEGVQCPDFIREQWKEKLIIDLDSSYPLDLTYADDGLSADLSFGGYVTRCTFPWKAIYVVADRATGRGLVFDQHMPESVRASRPPTTGPLPNRAQQKTAAVEGKRVREANASTTPEEVQRRRAAFRVIDGGN